MPKFDVQNLANTYVRFSVDLMAFTGWRAHLTKDCFIFVGDVVAICFVWLNTMIHVYPSNMLSILIVHPVTGFLIHPAHYKHWNKLFSSPKLLICPEKVNYYVFRKGEWKKNKIQQ